VLDALSADQGIGNLLDCAYASLDHENLDAVVMVQVDVQSGEDVMEVRVLQVG